MTVNHHCSTLVRGRQLSLGMRYQSSRETLAARRGAVLICGAFLASESLSASALGHTVGYDYLAGVPHLSTARLASSAAVFAAAGLNRCAPGQAVGNGSGWVVMTLAAAVSWSAIAMRPASQRRHRVTSKRPSSRQCSRIIR